ncbi:MAG: ABC transporter permease [Candidatus Omnitrophota bacterium]
MIRLEGVTKTYSSGPSGVTALNQVSLTIERGEFVAIMGASGSGKSTLMHILGLLDSPTEGKYFLCGKDVSSLTEDERAQLRNSVMGFIFQKFYLLPRLAAQGNVSLPLVYRGNQNEGHKAIETLEIVGLRDRAHHHSNQLSGGQQQRVAIARALIGDPLILFADEPTGNLDSHSTGEIMSLLEELHGQGRTIIMVTHEADVAAHAGRVLTMRDGMIVDDTRKSRAVLRSAAVNEGVNIDDIFHQKMAGGSAEIRDHLRQAWFAILANKVRTILSVLGVLIGVGAVIAMMALGEGANAAIKEQMKSLGANVLSIRSGPRQHGRVSLEAGTVTRLTMADSEAVGRLPLVKASSAEVTGRAQVVYGNKNWNTRIDGVGEKYEQIQSATPLMGRFFTSAEAARREKVAVIGMTVLNELFPNEYPIGKTIKINRSNFRVIGVLPSKGQRGWHDQDDVIVIPINTAMYRVLGKDYVDSIEADIVSTEQIEPAKELIAGLIMKRHLLGPEDTESFNIRDMTEIKEMFTSTTRTMTLLLSFIAVISLVVGGIGIMNIMLVSVTERTNEIGLRKAIGARQKDILAQFLIEAVMLTVLGGLVGIFLGCGASFLLSHFAGWATRISVAAILASLIFSVLVGIVFGLWPAYKAAQLSPIDALRYE